MNRKRNAADKREGQTREARHAGRNLHAQTGSGSASGQGSGQQLAVRPAHIADCEGILDPRGDGRDLSAAPRLSAGADDQLTWSKGVYSLTRRSEVRFRRQDGRTLGIRSALLSRYGHPRRACLNAGRDIIMETDHEEAQYPWDCRWSGVIDCDAVLASMVARKECGAIP